MAIPPDGESEVLRRRMIDEQIVARGLRQPDVLNAIRSVPRELFVPSDRQGEAYEDRALPIGHGQTISQPFIVAYMTEHLAVTSRCRVLEIGTGSGYQTAILARLAGTVASVERIDALRHQAARQITALGIENVTLYAGDGSIGLPDLAPFDRILVTAAAPKVPVALTQQLAPGGRMLIPVGGPKEQRLQRVDRLEHRTIETPLLACRFVKLLGTGGWKR